MKLGHEFTVPVPAAQAWPVLLDIERIAPCMPGATVTRVEGRDFDGKVRVRVGPITVTYNGSASFTEIDETARRAVITARGKEARGTGTANATITAQLHDEGDHARVTVVTDLAVTGRPAQFGRGVMNDVGAKLLNRFAASLSGQLAEGPEQHPPADVAPAEDAAVVKTASVEAAWVEDAASPGPPPATPAPEPSGRTDSAAPPRPAPVRVSVAPRPAAAGGPTDLLEAAGGPLATRLAPALVLLLLVFLVSRRRRRRGRG